MTLTDRIVEWLYEHGSLHVHTRPFREGLAVGTFVEEHGGAFHHFIIAVHHGDRIVLWRPATEHGPVTLSEAALYEALEGMKVQ